MSTRSPVVFLFDVDNTLRDNDRIAADLKRHLEREVGRERQERITWVPSSAIGPNIGEIRTC